MRRVATGMRFAVEVAKPLLDANLNGPFRRAVTLLSYRGLIAFDGDCSVKMRGTDGYS